ncbi:4217_t:CDS:2 [Racocetra persica]|uniref:4217_t:CDS:1 n=1 Tax=Racocetra persica TaxID=160502 RepID=A0ACA9L397_9GLOM|nr:4217_t:CDS:2 [Racocetra persica]
MWAIGAYPVGCKDSKIELVLFVLANSDDYNLETYAKFEKYFLYSVGGKIVPGVYGGKKRPKITVSVSTCIGNFNQDDKFGKCPLKVFFVGVPQELPYIVDNDRNVIFKFINLKSLVRLLNSLVFVVRQMEVFDNDFYVYTKDINYVNTHFSPKLSTFDSSNSNNYSDISNMTWAQLLSIYHNIIGSLKETLDAELFSSISLHIECSEDFISDTDNIDSCAFKVDDVIDVDEVVQDGEIKSVVKRDKE